MATDSVTVSPTYNGDSVSLTAGLIVRLKPGANNTVVRAQADSLPHVQGVNGVVVSGGSAPGTSCTAACIGRQVVQMESGLVLSVGDTVYVSPTVPGKGTNVQPGSVATIGSIADISNYVRLGTVVVEVIVGEQGTAGAAGPQGPQGAAGANGATGAQGFQGATGVQGPSAGFGPAPLPTAMTRASTAGSAATAWRSDATVGQTLTADWALTTTRTFLIDPVNGSDANAGFSDAAGPYNPATQAVATFAALLLIMPRQYAGRKFRLIMASGTYASGIDALLAGIVGHGSGCLVRGTTTNATASSVAFADDANERICAGYVTGTGLNAAGYNPIGSPSTTVIQMLKVGGGAAALPAEPGKPLMLRIRFDSATATVALRNICRTVIVVAGTDTVTLDSALPAVPATGGSADTFYFEQGGIAMPAFSLSTGANQPATSLQLVGIVSSGAVVINDGRYILLGFGAASLQFNCCQNIATPSNGTYSDPIAITSVVCGGGTRSEGTITFQSSASQSVVGNLLSVGSMSVISPVQLSMSTGIVLAAGITVTGSVAPLFGGSGNGVRIIGPNAATGIGIGAMTYGSLGIMAITGMGAKPAVRCNNNAEVLLLSSTLTGSTGNTDVGLDLSVARGVLVILLSQPTVTGTAGDVRLAGGQIVTWAALLATGLVDSGGNRIVSGAVGVGGSLVGQSFTGTILGAGGATVSYLADQGIGLAANNTTAFRRPTSLRLAMRLRVTSISNTAANAVTCTLYKSGVATAMQVSIPAGSAANTKLADLSHPILFADGDDYDLRLDDAADGGAVVNVSASLEWAAA